MNTISKTLFQGNREDAIKASQDKSVDFIFYLGQEIPPQLSHESQVPVIHFPLKNGFSADSKKFEMLFTILSYAEVLDKVLVSCRYGESRSPLICLGFLVMYENYTFSSAYELIKSNVSTFKLDDILFNSLKGYIGEYVEEFGLREPS